MKRLAAAFGLFVLLTLPVTAAASTDDPTSGLAIGAQMGVGVTIVDFAFQPSSIVVAPGSTVSWYNAGAAPHTVTSPAGGFDSGALGPGGGYGITFSTPGTYGYYCAIHPSMTGTVIVSGM